VQIHIEAKNDSAQSMMGNLSVPEIRAYINDGKEHKHYTFSNFGDAMTFIKSSPLAEPHPLIAFRGFLLDIFDVRPAKRYHNVTRR